MIIAGDVALGKRGMKLVLPEELSEKSWVVNLEGSLVREGEKYIHINGVFNDYDAISDLKAFIRLKVVSLANNHILDVAGIEETVRNTDDLGLLTVGAGRNLSEAHRTVELDGYTLVSFGWQCIECPQAGPCKEGVAPYEKEYVLKTVGDLVCEGKRVVCIFHWNYEFELYPQPYDRELAHRLIDIGAYAIIGAHSHRVQHFEIYKRHPIVYGLGNFMFSRNVFFNHRLDFGDRSSKEMAFELGSDGTFAVHIFEYSHGRDEVRYVFSDKFTPSDGGNAPFGNMSSEEYAGFFKANRVQKKLLPIFYYGESECLHFVKVKFIALRGWILSVMVKTGVKSQKR